MSVSVTQLANSPAPSYLSLTWNQTQYCSQHFKQYQISWENCSPCNDPGFIYTHSNIVNQFSQVEFNFYPPEDDPLDIGRARFAISVVDVDDGRASDNLPYIVSEIERPSTPSAPICTVSDPYFHQVSGIGLAYHCATSSPVSSTETPYLVIRTSSTHWFEIEMDIDSNDPTIFTALAPRDSTDVTIFIADEDVRSYLSPLANLPYCLAPTDTVDWIVSDGSGKVLVVGLDTATRTYWRATCDAAAIKVFCIHQTDTFGGSTEVTAIATLTNSPLASNTLAFGISMEHPDDTLWTCRLHVVATNAVVSGAGPEYTSTLPKPSSCPAMSSNSLYYSGWITNNYHPAQLAFERIYSQPADDLLACGLIRVMLEYLDLSTQTWTLFQDISCVPPDYCDSPTRWWSDTGAQEYILDADYPTMIDISQSIIRACPVNQSDVLSLGLNTPDSCTTYSYPVQGCAPPDVVACRFDTSLAKGVIDVVIAAAQIEQGCAQPLSNLGSRNDPALYVSYTEKESGKNQGVYVMANDMPAIIPGKDVNVVIEMDDTITAASFTSGMECSVVLYQNSSDKSPTGTPPAGPETIFSGDGLCPAVTELNCPIVNSIVNGESSRREVQFKTAERCWGQDDVKYMVELVQTNVIPPSEAYSISFEVATHISATNGMQRYEVLEETGDGTLDLFPVSCTVTTHADSGGILTPGGSVTVTNDSSVCDTPHIRCQFEWTQDKESAFWSADIIAHDECTNRAGFSISYKVPGAEEWNVLSVASTEEAVNNVHLENDPFNESDIECSAASINSNNYTGHYQQGETFYSTTTTTTHSEAKEVEVLDDNVKIFVQSGASVIILLLSIVDLFDMSDACFGMSRGNQKETAQERIDLLRETARRNSVIKALHELQLERMQLGASDFASDQRDHKIVVYQNTMELEADLHGEADIEDLLHLQAIIDEKKIQNLITRKE